MRSTTTAERKAALRRQIRAYLRELSPGERAESDAALFARLLALPQLVRSETVLIYLGMGAEPDTARLLPPLLAMGKRVALPRCLPGNQMEARAVQTDSALVRHPYGMLEPGEDCPAVPREEIGLILVPGLAFDRSGGRLGQGGGFYDRYLAGCGGFTAALCRRALLYDALPREEHDLGVDLVITEDGGYGPSA